MAPTADARASRPGEIAGSAVAEPSEAGVPVAVARPSSWAKLAENPLLALLATAVVALLIFNLTSTNARITETNDRITRLDNRMEARFAAQDVKIEALDAKLTAQIAALDAKIDEMNLKLTALVAALNMTDQVDAATAGTAALGAPTQGPDSTK